VQAIFNIYQQSKYFFLRSQPNTVELLFKFYGAAREYIVDSSS